MTHARQGRQLRVFVAGLSQETNSFSPLPTSLRNFEDTICQHFRASFDRIARQTVYCNAPGALNLDLASMPYRKVRLTRRGTAFTVEAP
jgi:microcystin degradation protein MlrC